MPLLKDMLNENDPFFKEWIEKNKNPKLDQPKRLLDSVKDVVKNIITRNYSKEDVRNA